MSDWCFVVMLQPSAMIRQHTVECMLLQKYQMKVVPVDESLQRAIRSLSVALISTDKACISVRNVVGNLYGIDVHKLDYHQLVIKNAALEFQQKLIDARKVFIAKPRAVSRL